MITLVCKLDKTSRKTTNTVYADDAEWFKIDDDNAYDMVQKNTVKEFHAVDAKFYYIETYQF